jgi:hypothetical protein
MSIRFGARTFTSVLAAHLEELDADARRELEGRVEEWRRAMRVVRNDWSVSTLPSSVASALGIEYRAHVRDAGARAAIFPELKLRYRDVLRMFELPKRRVVCKLAALPDEAPSARAGEIVAAALVEPSMRAFRAWALGYLAMHGTVPSTARHTSFGGNGIYSVTEKVVSLSR